MVHPPLSNRYPARRPAGRKTPPAVSVLHSFFQFIADGAHRPDPRRACRHQAGQKRQRKAFAAQNRLICSIFFAPICRVVYALLPGLVWGARRDFIQNTAFFSPFIRKSTGVPPIFLHFPLRYAILSCELNRKTAGAFCRLCAAGRVKGKRVQIPHDLVTVIREPASGCFAPAIGALL